MYAKRLPPQTCLSGRPDRARTDRIRVRPATNLRGLGALWLIALLAGCQTALFPPAANPPAQANLPRLEVGDTWVYRHTDGYTKLPRGSFTHTISEIAGDVVTVQVKAEDGGIVATDRYTRGWNWLDKPMTNIQRFRYSPPYPAFQFPLQAGAQWSAQMKVTDAAIDKTYDLARVDANALEWQRVTVPAGAFDAILVRRAAYSGVRSFVRSQEYILESDWYAPAVNNVAFGSYRSEYWDFTAMGEDDNGFRTNDWTLVELVDYRPAQK
jgi:hypothetical protein